MFVMRYILFILLLAVSTKILCQSTIESIPNQKLINNSYVSNPDKILNESTVSELDTLLTSLEKKTTVQVAVVVVESIGDADVFEFAQQIFTTWGIGNKQKDNGLLLLLVKDRHTIRFHTGYGVEGALPDVICKRIQTEFMVPEFKNDNYNAGMLAGAKQVEKILTDPVYAEELKEPEATGVSDFVGLVIFLALTGGLATGIVFIIFSVINKFSDSKNPEETPYPEMRVTKSVWLIQFAVIPVVIVALWGFAPLKDVSGWVVLSLYVYYLLTLVYRLWRMQKVINRFLKNQDYQEIVEFLRQVQLYWLFMAILFPIPFVLYFFYHRYRRRMYRDHPRSCKECQAIMQKMSELTEDEYLTTAMQMEEKLKAVNYDVWKCPACQSLEILHYLNRNSEYEPCPKCKTIAFYMVSKRTITRASYSSSGKGEKVLACKFCKHTHKSTYSIPKLTSSSSSSSSGFSSRSRSSSSGGSWGGGSSGGGGASSSW
jgi:uncharacterized protein